MPILPRLVSLWRNIIHKDQVERELDDEAQAYLELLITTKMESGVDAVDARRAAQIEMGGVEQVKERVREGRLGHHLEMLWRDLHVGARILRKQPGFTLIAVLTLGLGIGANTGVFSIVNAVLLRPFAYQKPERLVMLKERMKTGGFSPSHPNIVDYRAQNTTLASIAAVRVNENFNLTGVGEPERLHGRLVSAEFFSTLGIKLFMGRDFLSEEDREGAAPAVILSYGVWQLRFGADQSIIGRQLTLNDQSYTVIGIAPPNFQFGAPADVTVPIGLSAKRFRLRGRDPGADAVARLKENVTHQQAETDLNLVAARLEQQYPETNKGRRVLLIPLHESVVGNVRQPLLILLGAVGLVLLIACANVANLMLVRSSTRQKEMAVRIALGASRATIIRQLLTESILLAALGAGLGILLAYWGTSYTAENLPDGIPRLQEVRLDASVLGFTLVVSLLTGLLFCLAPALQITRPNLTEGLKEGERGSSGRRQILRSLLVVGEVALTLTLLVGAGLLVQSFRRLVQVDLGINARNLLTMDVSVDKGDGPQVAHFFEQLQQNVSRLPGVTSVAVTDGLPLWGANHPAFIIEGRSPSAKKPNGVRYTVSPDYFRTMGIELIKGRLFNVEDTPNTQMVIIIDETLARRYFTDEDPIGKRLRHGPDAPGLEIVGVVRHVKHYSLEEGPLDTAQFYLNYNQVPLQQLAILARFTSLVARTESDPLSLVSAVRGQVAALNKDQSLFNVRTMEQIVGQNVASRRFSMLLLSGFAVVALALASLGIYGSMSYAVAQRTREIGVRMALGANAGDVLRMVIGQGMKLALAGVALGLAASLALTRTIQNMLYDVSATDPTTFAALALLLTAVALLACWIPARRATHVDPLSALRHE